MLCGYTQRKEMKSMQKSESNLNTPKYEIRPASPDEAGLFFGMPPE